MAYANSVIARAYLWLSSAREERGQTFAEYAVIIGIIAVAVVGAVGTLRDSVVGAITKAAADI
jgi:Flp pilus assembly pilin Flp